MASPTGYSLRNYGDMVRSEPRMGAFDRALRDAVTPGCTVIDLGAGPGVFALLACRYGAGKVIAIEPDNSVELLRQLALDNGCADRIEIVHGLSSDYCPSAKADVIISDLRGGLPLFERHIEIITDARERLLAPGGRLIPARDHIRVAAVEAADYYKSYEQPWRSNDYGLDLSAGLRFVMNDSSRTDLPEEALLGTPQHLATLDYATISDPEMRQAVDLPVERGGTMHGLLLWFDTELGGGATYSNAPGQPPLVYSATFLPLEQPVCVSAGDRVHAEIVAILVAGQYVWAWNVALSSVDGTRSPMTRQSSFLSRIFDPAALMRQSDGRVPQPEAIFAIDAYCLSLVDGVRSVREIAAASKQKFPSAFTTDGAAVSHVVKLLNR